MAPPKGSTKARRPTALKLLEGTYNPSLANKAEPQAPSKIPACPEYLTAHEKASWAQFAEQLEPLHVTAEVDFAAFEALVCVHSQWLRVHQALRDQEALGDASLTYETSSEDGPLLRRAKPEVQMLKELGAQLKDWLGRFGLTPADRGRVSSKPIHGQGKKPLAEFT